MLVTGKSYEQESRSQNMMINRIVKRYERIIAREIARAMNQAAKDLGSVMWQQKVHFKHAENITSILTRLWTQAGTDASKRLFKLVKSIDSMERKFAELDTPIVTGAVTDWIKVNGGRRITEITNTTMSDINKVIADGVGEGLGEREIGRLVSSVAPSKGASRSQTIARTEAHGSSQGISLDVANQSDILMKKVWLSDQGESAREEHLDANGQSVAMSESFNVGGEALEYPGAPGGSAENVINCKCVIGYELA